MKSPHRFFWLLFALAIALLPAQATVAVEARTLARDDDQWATKQADGWALVDNVISPEVVQVRTRSDVP